MNEYFVHWNLVYYKFKVNFVNVIKICVKEYMCLK